MLWAARRHGGGRLHLPRARARAAPRHLADRGADHRGPVRGRNGRAPDSRRVRADDGGRDRGHAAPRCPRLFDHRDGTGNPCGARERAARCARRSLLRRRPAVRVRCARDPPWRLAAQRRGRALLERARGPRRPPLRRRAHHPRREARRASASCSCRRFGGRVRSAVPQEGDGVLCARRERRRRRARPVRRARSHRRAQARTC